MPPKQSSSKSTQRGKNKKDLSDESDFGFEEETKIKKQKRKQISSDNESSDDDLPPNTVRTINREQKKKKVEKVGEFPFLVDRLDSKRRPPTDPDYDKSTLYISLSDMDRLLGFEQQYWNLKKNHMDKILIIQVGAFYELYEDDAEIGKKELDLVVNYKERMNKAGFKTEQFNKFASQLFNLGYEYVRVDEVQTSEQMKESKKKGILQREIVEISTVSTNTNLDLISDSENRYLLCVKEDLMHSSYGITFLDICMDKFYIGFIKDDNQRNQFNTLIHTINPKEVIFEKKQVSAHTKKIVKEANQKSKIRELKTVTEMSNTDFIGFPTAEVTNFHLESYSLVLEDPTIKKLMDNSLVMSSFGACLFFLKSLRKDDVFLSKSTKYLLYDGIIDAGHMILDGQTLVNLEVKQNSLDGSKKGTLLDLVDNTHTPMGKRLLEKWITMPLMDAEKINDRYDAIEDITNIFDEIASIRNDLTGIRDIERFLSRIYRESRVTQSQLKTNKSNLLAYLNSLDGLRIGLTVIEKLQTHRDALKSNILKQIINYENIEEVSGILNQFEKEIDRTKARRENIVERTSGSFGKDYDTLEEKIFQLKQEIEEFIEKTKETVSSAELKVLKGKYFIQTNLKTKLIDMPGFKQEKELKTLRYFSHPFLEKKYSEIKLFESKLEEIRLNQFKEILSNFAEYDNHWKRILKSISELDCILSLHSISTEEGYCRPVILPSQNNRPILKVSQMRHPTVRITGTFIPNDIVMGADSARTLVVTGPNMGGKSTILRSACISVILAQMGCFVPAESCQYTPVDRIFTRIGANDRILAGESTFMVELLETSNIIQNATSNSLVILDELGRGTSTHDGYAIANSVVQYISDVIGCLCLFSTHYFELTEELKNHPSIDFYKMNCEVEKDKTGRIMDVIFLYEFVQGVCEKSYGIQVAKKAQVPQAIEDLNAEEIIGILSEFQKKVLGAYSNFDFV